MVNPALTVFGVVGGKHRNCGRVGAQLRRRLASIGRIAESALHKQSKGRYMTTRLTRICFAVAALLAGSLAAQAARPAAAQLLQDARLCRAGLRQLDRLLCRHQRRLRLGHLGLGLSGARRRTRRARSMAAPSAIISRPAPGSGASRATSTAPASRAAPTASAAPARPSCRGSPPARLRLGYAAWNNWLPFLTGGAAYGDVKATSPFGDASKSELGWTAGGGLEYALRRQLERQGRISLRRPRQIRLRQHLRRHARQCQLQVVDRARRHQSALLSFLPAAP